MGFRVSGRVSNCLVQRRMLAGAGVCCPSGSGRRNGIRAIRPAARLGRSRNGRSGGATREKPPFRRGSVLVQIDLTRQLERCARDSGTGRSVFQINEAAVGSDPPAWPARPSDRSFPERTRGPASPIDRDQCEPPGSVLVKTTLDRWPGSLNASLRRRRFQSVDGWRPKRPDAPFVRETA